MKLKSSNVMSFAFGYVMTASLIIIWGNLSNVAGGSTTIKRELQAEQHPKTQPNEYNKQVARASARWKGMQIRQAHGEMEHEAGAEVSAKRARLKSIMSR